MKRQERENLVEKYEKDVLRRLYKSFDSKVSKSISGLFVGRVSQYLTKNTREDEERATIIVDNAVLTIKNALDDCIALRNKLYEDYANKEGQK